MHVLSRVVSFFSGLVEKKKKKRERKKKESTPCDGRLEQDCFARFRTRHGSFREVVGGFRAVGVGPSTWEAS